MDYESDARRTIKCRATGSITSNPKGISVAQGKLESVGIFCIFSRQRVVDRERVLREVRKKGQLYVKVWWK